MTLTLQIIWLIGAVIWFIFSILAHEKQLEYAYTQTVVNSTIEAIVWPISIFILLWELWKEWRG